MSTNKHFTTLLKNFLMYLLTFVSPPHKSQLTKKVYWGGTPLFKTSVHFLLVVP